MKMWVLIPIVDSGTTYHLVVGKEYVVGRKEPCDIILPTDMSISRRHAILRVDYKENHVSHPEQRPQLKLKDLSKFGTVVCGQKATSQEMAIKDLSEIQFGGAGTSVYRAKYEPYVATTSVLDPASKKSTKQCIYQLGGHMSNEWTKDCQIVVMTKLSVTIKVICALVSMKPVVTPKYLEDFVKALTAKTKLPDPNDYLPPLAESQLDPNTSFKANNKRRKVFTGKLFLFLNPKQFKKLSLAIELGGGVPMLAEEGTDDNISEDIIVQPDTCVMNYDPSLEKTLPLSQNANEWIEKVMNILKSHKRRPISESEIGFAVLYCSTETHCNPEVDYNPERPNTTIPPQSFTQGVSQMHSAPHTFRERKTHTQSARQPKTQTQTTKVETVVPDSALLTEVKTEQPSQGSTRRTQRNTEAQETASNTARVKEEPVTPKQPRVEAEKRTTSREATKANENSMRNTVKINDESSNRSTEIDDFLDASLRGRRRRKEPSPAPPSPKPARNHDSEATSRPKRSRDGESPVSPKNKRAKRSPHRTEATEPLFTEPQDSVADTDIAVDSMFSQASRRRATAKDTKQTSQNVNSQRPDLDILDLDSAPLRGRRGRGRKAEPTKPSEPTESPKPAHEIVSVKTENTAVSQTSQKRRRVSDSDDNSAAQPQKRFNKERLASGDAVVPETQNESDDDMFGTNNNAKKPDTPKVRSSTDISDSNRGSPERVNLKKITKQSPKTSAHVRYDQPRSGWLSIASKPQSAVEKTPIDEDLPVGLVVNEEKSLMVRQPGQRRGAGEPTDLGGNWCEWNGRKIRNFKNFRKNHQIKHLPHIIGGTDLVVYADNLKAQDDWFREERQEQSEQQQNDRFARELFEDTEEPMSKPRGRANRGRRK